MLTKEEILDKAVPYFVTPSSDLEFEDYVKRAVGHVGDLSAMYKVDSHNLTRKDMVKADVSMDELMDSVPDAIDRKHKALVVSLSDVLQIQGTKKINHAYVVCSTTCGAEIACGKDAQKQLSRLFPEGYYLVPASIREMIGVSKREFAPDQLKDILQTVNQSIGKEEVLSNEIFDVENGKLRCVTEQRDIVKSPADDIRSRVRDRERDMDYER